MGLSDEERWSGLMYATDSLTRFGERTPMKKLTRLLWHALIGESRNSSHWLLGSSATGKVKWDAKSPWGRGIMHHTEDMGKPDPWEEVNKEFNAKDTFSIANLLRHKGSYDRETSEEMADIYELFCWTEQAIYYLRRYKDDFSRGLKSYDVLISRIQGACFSEFKKDGGYAKAYVVNQIMDYMYCGMYPYQKKKWDPLTRWLSEKNAHHDMDRCMEMNLEDLAKIHKSLDEDKSIKNKVLNLAQLLVRRLHNYKDDEFIKKYVPEDMFLKAKKMYEDHNKPRSDEYPDMSLYGLDCMFKEKEKKRLK